MFECKVCHRKIGTLRWYKKEKGYGFISDKIENGKVRDIFFHISEFKSISGDPVIGSYVQYKLLNTEKGLKAVDCVYVENLSDICS